MLTGEEIELMRRFLMRAEVPAGTPIAKVTPEIMAWKRCMNALEREQAVLTAPREPG